MRMCTMIGRCMRRSIRSFNTFPLGYPPEAFLLLNIGSFKFPPSPAPPPPLKYVTNRVFSVHTISNVTSFFRAEKSLPNLQCGPLTRLVRGIYLEDNYGLLHGYSFSGPFSISLILKQESAVLKRRTELFLR